MEKEMRKIFSKIKKYWKEILTSIGVIIGIIISFLAGWKTKEKINKEKNWRKIKNKSDSVEIKDEKGNWKEVRLPEDKDGKQIKSDKIKSINISEGGKIDVTIKEGSTDRRNVSSLDDDVFSPLDL
jgi:hypothetical protein